MFEFSVINRIPAETVRNLAAPDQLRKDEALIILREPRENSDEEIFSALCAFAGEKLALSPVITKNKTKGIHLFAEVWRYGSQFFYQDNKDLFTSCFGTRNTYHWYPLANAVYFHQENELKDMVYDLDPVRQYECRGGIWMEKKYENIFFEKKRFQALIHEADRMLRLYLKTGHPLKEKPEENWSTPYVHAVIEIDKKAELEAAKPKITIDLSGLDRIRRDALHTRDSLLTEEEMDNSEEKVLSIPSMPDPADQKTENAETTQESINIPLDPMQIRILQTLVKDGNADQLINENHLIPSVVTDAINEALFDEIGDSVLEYNGSIISIVEDYKEDIINMLGGNN